MSTSSAPIGQPLSKCPDAYRSPRLWLGFSGPVTTDAATVLGRVGVGPERVELVES